MSLYAYKSNSNKDIIRILLQFNRFHLVNNANAAHEC